MKKIKAILLLFALALLLGAGFQRTSYAKQPLSEYATYDPGSGDCNPPAGSCFWPPIIING